MYQANFTKLGDELFKNTCYTIHQMNCLKLFDSELLTCLFLIFQFAIGTLMDDYLGEFLFDIIFYPGINLPPTLSLGLHPLCGGRDLLFLLSPPPPLVSALTRKPLLGNFSGKFLFCVFQFLQQNPRWPPKSYGAR